MLVEVKKRGHSRKGVHIIMQADPVAKDLPYEGAHEWIRNGDVL